MYQEWLKKMLEDSWKENIKHKEKQWGEGEGEARLDIYY